MYLDHYDNVLAFCKKTARRPAGERFKWVCETAWQARHYLTHRPERLGEFLEYVRAGQIEITAAYFHLMDLADPDLLRHSFDWIADFCAQHNVPLTSAVQVDINGWPWAMADQLAEIGVKYLATNIHLDSGLPPLDPPGTMHYFAPYADPRLKRELPTVSQKAIRWAGPRGGEVLVWLCEHYHQGNFLGVSGCQGVGEAHTRLYTPLDRMTAADLLRVAEERLPAYVEHLRSQHYPLPGQWMSTGGYLYDNAAPSDRTADLVRLWNDKHGDQIELCTATLREWFEYLESLKTNVPRIQAAWPSVWAFGLGSNVRDISLEKEVQRLRPAVEALRREVTDGPAGREMDALLSESRAQELLALEHTFGSWDSALDPYSMLARHGSADKQCMFLDARDLAGEAAEFGLQELHPPRMKDVFRPALCAWLTEPETLLEFSGGLVHPKPDRQVLVAADGAVLPFQPVGDNRRFVVHVRNARPGLNHFSLREQAQPKAPAAAWNGRQFENAHFRLEFTAGGEGLWSFLDKTTGRVWNRRAGAVAFGAVVHEEVPFDIAANGIFNTIRARRFDYYKPEAQAGIPQPPLFNRHVFRFAGLAHRPGPVFDEIVEESAPGPFGQLRRHWRLYHGLPVMELALAWNKPWNERAEACFVAFPLQMNSGRLYVENSGGMFQTNGNGDGGQIPGTSSILYTAQRGVWAEDAEGGLAMATVDAPLVMRNGIDFMRWDAEFEPFNGFLAGMPVNHYWHCNFDASQQGPLHVRYRFAAGASGLDNVEKLLRRLTPSVGLGWADV